MRKLLAVLFVGIVVLASGCIGEQTGLTKEKVLTAIQNVETAHYNESFSVREQIFISNTNETTNVSTSGYVTGVFDRSAGIEAGNLSVTTYSRGMNINLNWPYFINGSKAYFKIDGKWYLVSSNNSLYNRAKGSLNIEYIEKLLEEKNVTFKKLDDGYAFRVNVTFWEFVNATSKMSHLKKELGHLSDNITVKTNAGWVEVHLKSDGTPTFVETYMDVTITVSTPLQSQVTVREIIHDSITLSGINEKVNITAPEGIESAKPLGIS